MTANIRIWWDESVQSYRCSTPYNKVFVEALKNVIPYSERAWDPSTKIWTISERALSAVQGLAEKYFGVKATVITKQQAQSARVPTSTAQSPIDTVILQFFRMLPQEAVRKAYLHATKIYHPDLGGDMTKMSDLNAMWTRLEAELWGGK